MAGQKHLLLLLCSDPAMHLGWCLGDEDFRQELLQRGEGKRGDHHSGALRVRTQQETTLPVKTIARRMHLSTTQSAKARPRPPPQLRPSPEYESERTMLLVSRATGQALEERLSTRHVLAAEGPEGLSLEHDRKGGFLDAQSAWQDGG